MLLMKSYFDERKAKAVHEVLLDRWKEKGVNQELNGLTIRGELHLCGVYQYPQNIKRSVYNLGDFF